LPLGVADRCPAAKPSAGTSASEMITRATIRRPAFIASSLLSAAAPVSGGRQDGALRRRLPSDVRRTPGASSATRSQSLPGDLLVVLIQALAVVGELAAAHEVAVAEADLAKPVGIGQRLPRRRHEVGLAAAQDGLGCSNAKRPPLVTTGVACPGRAHGGADRGGQRTLRPNGPRSSEITVGMHS